MNNFKSFLFKTAIIFALPVTAIAQNSDQEILNTVKVQDSLFWKGYNTCDLELQGRLIDDDIEFYHDKGGVTLGKVAMIASIKNNLCGEDYRLRRNALDSTVKVHLLKKNEVVYGALFTGEHNFYLNLKGKPERLDGHASFADLWLLKDGEWKLSRVFSYDHGPAKYINKRKPIKLKPSQMEKVSGSYKGEQSGEIIVAVESDHLKVSIGTKSFLIYPEREGLFFMKDRDLTFSFESASNGKHLLIIREYGEPVERAERTEARKH